MIRSEPWPLPSTWRWARFGEIARVASALVDPADHQAALHVAPNHIEAGSGRLLPVSTIAADGVMSANHAFRRGQLLYSKIRPYLAKVVVAEFDGLCSADMYPIETEMDARFLKWWMLTGEFTRRAAGEQARTVLPKINVRSLVELPVPVPPLGEQRRIVDLLESHLTHLDAARVLLDQSRRRVPHLATSSLGVMGAKVTSVELSDVLASPLRHGRSVPTAQSGFPVLRLTALAGDVVDLAERKVGSWTAAEAAPFLVAAGDFLVARGSGSRRLVGRGALVVGDVDPVAYPDTAIRVRVDPERLHAPYLAAIWGTPLVRRQIERMAKTTAGIHKVNQADLRSVQIPLPDLDEQRAIHARYRDLSSQLKRLESQVIATGAAETSLRSSLFAAAFEGRLSAPDGQVLAHV